MVLFNYSTKELTAKVVYYGPGLCGKTTNLQWIHEKTPIKNKGKMLSLATEADRTLFFDFLPIDLGTIRGMKTRIQLYTVPGQVFYNATRRMVLKGADCVVFVADSQEPVLDANLDALANLKENLEANEIDPGEIPTVLQYNKRDLPNALPLEILNEKLNPRGLPFFEAVAMKGQGVDETLKAATGLVFKSLATKYGGGGEAGAKPPPPRPTTPPPSELSLGSGTELDAADELSLDAPVRHAPESPGRTTLIRTANEADDLRARIGRTADPELTLDTADPDDEDIEEISFDTAPNLVPESEPAPAPVRPAAPSPAASRPATPSGPPVSPRTLPPTRAAAGPSAASGSVTIPPVAAPSSKPTENTAPIRVSATVNAGANSIALPVEVTVKNGQGQVEIQLKIILDLKMVP